MSHVKYINITDFETEFGTIQDIELSYQLFGPSLHSAPTVLVNHALTGNSNVSGKNGWWNNLIGPDKCIDTSCYTVLAFNVPGNGYFEKDSNRIDNYKDFVARDVARLFAEGLDVLNIDHLFAVIGGSVGGGISWELAALKPNLTQHLIPIATDWKSTDWVIANCHIQDALLNNSSKPLEDSRMHAMTLYRTPESFTSKFSRSVKEDFLFNVEGWLNYHGETLSSRFSISAYKLMNQILKTIDITRGRYSFEAVVSKINSDIHIVTINSDLFFRSEEDWETYVDLKLLKSNVSINEIKSIHGHDAFLMEYGQLEKILKPVFEFNKDTRNEKNTYSHIWNR